MDMRSKLWGNVNASSGRGYTGQLIEITCLAGREHRASCCQVRGSDLTNAKVLASLSFISDAKDGQPHY